MPKELLTSEQITSELDNIYHQFMKLSKIEYKPENKNNYSRILDRVDALMRRFIDIENDLQASESRDDGEDIDTFVGFQILEKMIDNAFEQLMLQSYDTIEQPNCMRSVLKKIYYQTHGKTVSFYDSVEKAKVNRNNARLSEVLKYAIMANNSREYKNYNHKIKSNFVKEFISETEDEKYYHFSEKSHDYWYNVCMLEMDFIFDVHFILEKKTFTESFKESDLKMNILLDYEVLTASSKITRTVVGDKIVYSMENGCMPCTTGKLDISCNAKPFTVYFKACRITKESNRVLDGKMSGYSYDYDSNPPEYYYLKREKFINGTLYSNRMKFERVAYIYNNGYYGRRPFKDVEYKNTDYNNISILIESENPFCLIKKSQLTLDSYNPLKRLIVFYPYGNEIVACYAYDDETGLYIDEKFLKANIYKKTESC